MNQNHTTIIIIIGIGPARTRKFVSFLIYNSLLHFTADKALMFGRVVRLQLTNGSNNFKFRMLSLNCTSKLTSSISKKTIVMVILL